MAEQISTPSFLRSTWEGMKGTIKGFIAGGMFGAAAGAGGGAILGALVTAVGGPVIGALVGAAALGGAFGAIGALSGTMTGVVRSRESGKVPVEDAVNAAQVALVQGMAIEQMRAQEKGTYWQDKLAKKDKQSTIDTGQRLHS